MIKLKIHLLTVLMLASILSYSQTIKSITRFKKESDSITRNTFTEFDKSGNKTLEINYKSFDPYAESHRNNVTTYIYKNGRKVSELECEDFVARDTCVLRSFSKFEFDKSTGILTETKFESDSLIRYIRETKRTENIESQKTYTWDFQPVKEPDYEKAKVYFDTIIFDEKNRKIKCIKYGRNKKRPLVESFSYSRKTYSYQTNGGSFEGKVFESSLYPKLQKLARKNGLDYQFYDDGKYTYKIEYYDTPE